MANGGGSCPWDLLPWLFLGRCLDSLSFYRCILPSFPESKPRSGRFDSNASASSSSNEGDSDREEKKREQLKRAKMAKDRKSRRKSSEVLGKKNVCDSVSFLLFTTSRCCWLCCFL